MKNRQEIQKNSYLDWKKTEQMSGEYEYIDDQVDQKEKEKFIKDKLEIIS